MALTAREVKLVMDALRGGGTLTHRTFGGRYVMTWGKDAEGYYIDDWAEGSSRLYRVDEAAMEKAIAEAPDDAFPFVLGKR